MSLLFLKVVVKPRTSSSNLMNKASSRDVNDEVNDNGDGIPETSADQDNNDDVPGNGNE